MNSFEKKDNSTFLNWQINPLGEGLSKNLTSNTNHTTINGIDRPVSEIKAEKSETVNKTNQIVQSLLAGLNTLATPFIKIAAFITSGLNYLDSKIHKASSYVLNLTPLQKTHTEVNSGLEAINTYSGEFIINAPRLGNGTALDTVKEQLQGVGKTTNSLIELKDPISGQSLQTLDGFHKDLDRSLYLIDGNTRLFDSEKFKKQNVEDWRGAAKYAACNQLNQRFGKQEALNISALIWQALVADLAEHVMHKFSVMAEGQGTTYEISEKKDRVLLILTNNFLIRSPGSNEELGYIGVQRRIFITKEDLAKDWGQSGMKFERRTYALDRYTSLQSDENESDFHQIDFKSEGIKHTKF